MASQSPSRIVKLSLPKQTAGALPPTASDTVRPMSASPPQIPAIPNILNQISQSHLVLALTIQKSKPQGISIKEYCEQLKGHIKISQKIVPEKPRYIDTCEFWKEQYMRIYSEKRELADKLRCAEESNRLLRQAHQSNGNISESEKFTVTPGSDIIDPSSSRKRLSACHEEYFFEEKDEDTRTLPLAKDELLRLSSYVVRIKEMHRKLQEACRVSDTLDQINDLIKHTTHTLAFLDSQFFDSCSPFFSLKINSAQKHPLDMLQRVIHQVGISYLECFRAFNELSRTIPGRSKKNEIIFQLVMFFNKSLNFLKTLSSLQSDSQDAPGSPSRRSKRARMEEEEYAVNHYLANMLSSVAYGLEWDMHHPGHSDLLEGILFTILEHTGRLLSESVFGEHVATSNNPGNIAKGSPRGCKQAARIQARYIVQILHAALGGDKKKGLVAQTLSASRTPAGHTRLASSHGSVLSGDLLLKAKKLLQSTLMKSTIGGQDLDSLRLPTPPLEMTTLSLPEAPVLERYGPDWLVETVWALVGWDLMD